MAGQLRTDEVQLRVLIDGTPARKALAELDQEAAELTQKMRGLRKGTEEYVAASKRLSEVSTEQAKLREQIGLTALTLKQLNAEAAKLRIMRNNITPGTEAWAENEAQLQKVNARIKELTNTQLQAEQVWAKMRAEVKLTDMSLSQLDAEVRRLKTAMSTLNPNTAEFRKYRDELKLVETRQAEVNSGMGWLGRTAASVKTQVLSLWAALAPVALITAAVNGFKNMITANAKLSDSQAEVMRTTGLTRREILQLTTDLGQLSTRTARAELLDLAKEAGKLGITGVQNVLAFVRAGDKLNVALGEELGEGAITAIGKLNQTFKVGEASGKDMEGQMLATGSAVTTLGNASTASGAFLVDYATRVAGVSTQSKISLQDTFGFAAALDQLGLRSETSSTAMSQFIVGAFKDTKSYAHLAGLELSDFQALLNKDVNEALLRVLDGLNGNNDGMAVMAKRFGDMGEEGARAVGVLSSLASNTKLVREQQKIANQSFSEGTSVIESFNNKNSSFAANLDIIGKKMASWFVNSSVVQGANAIARSLREMIEVPVSQALEEERVSLSTLYAQILITNQGTSERVTLIKELQSRYPELLGNLNAETVTNEQLSQSIALVNEQMINKIVLQKKQEELDKAQEVASEKVAEQLEREREARELNTRIVEKYGLSIDVNARTLFEQLQSTNDKVRALVRAGKADFDDLIQIGNAQLAAEAAEGITRIFSRAAAAIEQEKRDLAQRLGLDKLGQTNGGPPKVKVDDSSIVGSGVPEPDKVQERLEELRARIEEWRHQIYLDALSDDSRNIAAVDDKYAKLRAEIMANEQHTAADLKALDDAYQQARADAIEAGGEKRLEAERKVQERMDQQRQAAQDRVYLDQQSDEDLEVVQAMQHFDELVALYEAAGVDTAELVERTERAIAAIRKKWRDKSLREETEASRKRARTFASEGQEVAGAVGAINSVMAAYYEASGQRNYQQAFAAKALGLLQIGLSSGVGVAKAIEAGAGVPWPANIGAIASGIAAVLGGIASAMALFNKVGDVPAPKADPAPTLNDVPLGAQGGVLDGSSHDDGGLAVIDNRTGRQVAELEGGEAHAILSKKFVANNADLLPYLFRASASGERLPLVARPIAPLNTAGIAQGLRMESGGLLGHYTFTKATGIAGGDTGYTFTKATGIARGEEPDWAVALLEELKRNTSATKRRIVFSQREFERSRLEYEKLRKRNEVG